MSKPLYLWETQIFSGYLMPNYGYYHIKKKEERDKMDHMNGKSGDFMEILKRISSHDDTSDIMMRKNLEKKLDDIIGKCVDSNGIDFIINSINNGDFKVLPNVDSDMKMKKFLEIIDKILKRESTNDSKDNEIRDLSNKMKVFHDEAIKHRASVSSTMGFVKKDSNNLLDFYEMVNCSPSTTFNCYYVINDNLYKILYTPTQDDYPIITDFTIEFINGIMQLKNDEADAFRKELIANYLAGSEKIVLIEDHHAFKIEEKGYVIIDDITF